MTEIGNSGWMLITEYKFGGELQLLKDDNTLVHQIPEEKVVAQTIETTGFR